MTLTQRQIRVYRGQLILLTLGMSEKELFRSSLIPGTAGEFQAYPDQNAVVTS